MYLFIKWVRRSHLIADLGWCITETPVGAFVGRLRHRKNGAKTLRPGQVWQCASGFGAFQRIWVEWREKNIDKDERR